MQLIVLTSTIQKDILIGVGDEQQRGEVMKKLVMLLIVLGATVFAQVELKGFVLGAKLTQAQINVAIKTESGVYITATTLAGIEGRCLPQGPTRMRGPILFNRY